MSPRPAIRQTDCTAASDVEKAWATEIGRRVEEVRGGRVELVSSEQLFGELDAIVDAGDGAA